jgi:hypothetical protein
LGCDFGNGESITGLQGDTFPKMVLAAETGLRIKYTNIPMQIFVFIMRLVPGVRATFLLTCEKYLMLTVN